MKLSDFYKTLEESFKHYTVKHKRTGKTYKVTAMHKNSALDKARAQHGGTASRYTGTSISDFEIVEGKSPHKKGTKKYKKHMAAMHAGESVGDNIKNVIKGLKGPKFYSLDKDAPHPTDDLDKLKQKKQAIMSSEQDMIGEPDDYYDADERIEAYNDLQDALQGNYMDDYIKDGVCPNCAGSGYQDGEDEVYNDETGEYEEGNECDGFGMFGCDQGEMTGASWVEIINHDKRKADRQKSKDEYPGDEEVIKQVASYMKQMDDPRMAYQQMQADFPFMGRGQRSEILGKASKLAFGEAMAMPTVKNTPQENDVCKILGKALGKDEQESCKFSPQELYSELESINPELADTIARLSKIVYDVKLEERVYKDVGVADVQKDARGKEFKFDKDKKQFKSISDPEVADIKTKLGKDLMKKRKSSMRKSTPSYNKKPAPKKPGFIASLFNDIEG